MINRIIKSIKKILYNIPLNRDYHSFISVYHESVNKWRFLKYRYFMTFSEKIYWPVHQHSEVRGRVIIGKGARVGHRPNCVIQGRGKVFIGDYVGIGPNCVIISANHVLLNQDNVVRKETIIGDYCWLASSSVILAGVTLGPRTIVGAGSVVTKSFNEGYCIIAGNPAKIIKRLDKENFVQNRNKVEYYGYIRQDCFSKFAKRKLSHITFDTDLRTFTSNIELLQLFCPIVKKD